MARKHSPLLTVLIVTLAVLLVGIAVTFAWAQNSKPKVYNTSPKADRPWSSATVEKSFGGTVPPIPQLVAVRTGTHQADGYDRIAFDFKNALPGYKVSSATSITRDGSGEKVNLAGKSFLKIVFNPAAAHDDSGKPTLSGASTQPFGTGYDHMQAYVLSGDFEGSVSYGLGLAASSGFRVADQEQSNGLWTVYVDVKY